jgi:hypothetical protein
MTYSVSSHPHLAAAGVSVGSRTAVGQEIRAVVRPGSSTRKLTCYQHADEATMLKVMESPAKLVSRQAASALENGSRNEWSRTFELPPPGLEPKATFWGQPGLS